MLRFYGQLDAILGLLLKKPLKNKEIVTYYWWPYTNWNTPGPAPHAVIDVAMSASIGNERQPKVFRDWLTRYYGNLYYLCDALAAKIAPRVRVGRYSILQWWIDKLRIQYPATL